MFINNIKIVVLNAWKLDPVIRKENISGNFEALKKKFSLSIWIFIYLFSLSIRKHWCFFYRQGFKVKVSPASEFQQIKKPYLKPMAASQGSDSSPERLRLTSVGRFSCTSIWRACEMAAGLVKAIPVSLRCFFRPIWYSDFIF